jgi:hypothetical protein
MREFGLWWRSRDDIVIALHGTLRIAAIKEKFQTLFVS